jgi:hypothetical protein
MDGIFYFTGRGLNWDMYGHHGPVAASGNPNSPVYSATANDELPCTPDANGYNTGTPLAINYYEWCQDHNKPLQVAPFGDVGAGGPATLPDPNIFTNGAWYSVPISARTRRCAPRDPTAVFSPQTRRRTHPMNAAGLSCGIRTMSARSLPTTSSQAACS